MLRQALIAKYINLLYEDTYQDWSNRNSNRLPAIARHALALSRYRHEKMPPGATMLEAFADFRDWMAATADEALEYLQRASDADVLKYLKDPNTAKDVRNVAFSYLKPDEYPTHRMLQELMYLDASGAERDHVIEISTLLLPWCRDGHYGCLFDGVSNLSLTGKIAHFELGCIPDSAKELKTAAGFLITNDARKHIITLPRGLRKRNVYEEVARFLDIPGGEEIVKESYAQLRKFNCWNISIVQQYARFKQSRIRSAVFGNSRQFFFMRQSDRADLDDIATDIALPDITRNAIMNYPLPDHQVGQKYCAFTYMHLDSNRSICGTVRNIASPEMLYCSSSTGEHFDRRARELRGVDNVVDGILTFSRKPELQEAT